MTDKIAIGVSTCLLGKNVRYDGGHKRDPYIITILGQFFRFVPVCPEVEAGFLVPREAFRLVGDPESPRLMTQKTAIDYTDLMNTWATNRCHQLETENLRGFIFKSKSPNSGLYRVKVYTNKGMPVHAGTGLFARVFTQRFPLIPVEEEGRLNDLPIRENFLERIFVYHRWLLFKAAHSPRGLVEFHTQHKLLLMSHDLPGYRACGTLVASIRQQPFDAIIRQYEQLLMKTLAYRATIRKHINVMQHIMGHFKKHLDSDRKTELLELFASYRDGLIPLIVPITMLNHYVRRFDVGYLKDQVYLNPHPMELKLRNHA
ncbi:DUF523 and DUF1722 domain-containing protein [bacterium]|nr:DUF523 and DUF1722 domain-containing protein [candidate division CSSED10-310 bacterium]